MLHFWVRLGRTNAESEFKRAIGLNRNYPTAHHWDAIYLSSMGRHDEAVVQIDLATRLDPVSAIIRASRGWVQYQRRQFDAAIQESRKTLEIDANFVRAHNYIGMSYMKLGRPDDALPDFTEANRSVWRRAGHAGASRGRLRAGRPHRRHPRHSRRT